MVKNNFWGNVFSIALSTISIYSYSLILKKNKTIDILQFANNMKVPGWYTVNKFGEGCSGNNIVCQGNLMPNFGNFTLYI